MCCQELIREIFTIYSSIMCVSILQFQGNSVLCCEAGLNSTSLSELTTNTSYSCQLGFKETEIPSNFTKSNYTSEDSTEKLFEDLRKKGLYYNFQSVLHDININKFKTGIVDLMHVHNRSEWISNTRQEYQAKDQIKKKKRMIFINVESVYNSKREMITKAVARRLKGRHMTTPPKFMRDIRLIIGTGTAKRLYYSLTKYSTANHVRQVLSTHAVVLERYWLHHAAFSIGKHFNDTDALPHCGHPIYKWPADLLAPDVLFFINATKTPYALGFNQPYTDFTDRLIEVFRRADGVKVVELNPTRNYPTIVRQIMDYVTGNFKDHPDIEIPTFDITPNKKTIPTL